MDGSVTFLYAVSGVSSTTPDTLQCPVPPTRLRRVAPTLSRRPLLWLLALAKIQEPRALADSAMKVLGLIMRTCGGELSDQEFDVALPPDAQAREEERKSGWQWTLWSLKPELSDQVQGLARACGWMPKGASDSAFVQCVADDETTKGCLQRVAETRLAAYFQAYLPPERCARVGCDQTAAAVRLRLCSRCKVVRYCSTECQKQHWPIHKASCVL